MVVEPVSDLQFPGKVLLNQLLKLKLSKNVVVPVVDRCLLVFIFDRGLYKRAVLRLRFYCRRLRLVLFVVVLQVPWDKDILSRELSMLLLVGPHQDEHFSTNLHDSVHFREGLHTKHLC